MAKTITFTTSEGVEYTLEFTRKSIETMERNGFSVGDIQSKPMTTLPALFRGAFLAHHRYVKPEVIDRLFSKFNNKEELLVKLAEMYNEPLESLMGEPEESEGNLTWVASW